MGRMATRRNTTRRICLELRLTGEAVNPARRPRRSRSGGVFSYGKTAMAENSFKEVLARLTPEELRLSMDNSESFSMRGMLCGLRRLRGERPLSEALLVYIEALEARYGRELDERDAMHALEDYD